MSRVRRGQRYEGRHVPIRQNRPALRYGDLECRWLRCSPSQRPRDAVALTKVFPVPEKRKGNAVASLDDHELFRLNEICLVGAVWKVKSKSVREVDRRIREVGVNLNDASTDDRHDIQITLVWFIEFSSFKHVTAIGKQIRRDP